MSLAYIQELLENDEFRSYLLYPTIGIVLYLIYLKIFKYYFWEQKFPFETSRAHKRRGNPPPSYPNGWFRISSTFLLKVGDVKYVKLNGRHLALYRGEDKVAYCVDAFCAHMGANLGIGGQVKWKSCIECPFHGWTFNGKDGQCVSSEKLDPRLTNTFHYQDENYTKGPEGYLKETSHKCTTKIKTHPLLEQDGEIYCWFHANDQEPNYKPPRLDFPMDSTITARSQTVEFINCHVQEIPENGADFKHFDYVHLMPVESFGHFLKFKWNPVTAFADDPEFYEKMGQHKDKKLREWQLRLFNNMLKDKENLPYINVLSLDSALKIADSFTINLVNATVFQIGPGLVYLFFKFPFWEQILVQGVTPSHAFTQQVTHKQFMTWWIPSWLCVLILKIYLAQVNADQKIWNNKTFDNKVSYVYNDYKDEHLKSWRNRYSRYYEGCAERERAQQDMDW